MNDKMIGRCPECNCSELATLNIVEVVGHVPHFERTDEGDIEPAFSGGSDVLWETGKSKFLKKPYMCTNCDTVLSLKRIVFTE